MVLMRNEGDLSEKACRIIRQWHPILQSAFKAGALGASGKSLLWGLLPTEHKKLHSGVLPEWGSRARRSKSLAPASPRPGRAWPWDCRGLLTTLWLCPGRHRSSLGLNPDLRPRLRLHSSPGLAAADPRAPWGRGRPSSLRGTTKGAA